MIGVMPGMAARIVGRRRQAAIRQTLAPVGLAFQFGTMAGSAVIFVHGLAAHDQRVVGRRDVFRDCRVRGAAGKKCGCGNGHYSRDGGADDDDRFVHAYPCITEKHAVWHNSGRIRYRRGDSRHGDKANDGATGGDRIHDPWLRRPKLASVNTKLDAHFFPLLAQFWHTVILAHLP